MALSRGTNQKNIMVKPQTKTNTKDFEPPKPIAHTEKSKIEIIRNHISNFPERGLNPFGFIISCEMYDEFSDLFKENGFTIKEKVITTMGEFIIIQ